MSVTQIVIRTESSALKRAVRSKIEAALIELARRDAERVYLEVEGNRVALVGTVSSFAEEREVIKAARSVPGVATVEDRLAVTIA